MVVCFIGHRTITNIEKVKIRLLETVAGLISSGADTFLFGSRSDFNYLCWTVVISFRTQFPNVKRISYNTPNEVAFTSIEERERREQLFSKTLKHKVDFADYEKAVDSQKSLNANKNAYIMRNQEMIDDSDICVFYYDKDYLPPRRRQSKSSILDYQPKSGTAMAFQYAVTQKKQIINIFK